MWSGRSSIAGPATRALISTTSIINAAHDDKISTKALSCRVRPCDCPRQVDHGINHIGRVGRIGLRGRKRFRWRANGAFNSTAPMPASANSGSRDRLKDTHQVARLAVGTGRRRRRDDQHRLDGRHPRPVIFHRAGICPIPPARKRENAVLAHAGKVLRGRGVVSAHGDDSNGLAKPARGADAGAPALADASLAGREKLSAQTIRLARRTNMISAGLRPANTRSPFAWTTAASWTSAKIPPASATTRRATGTASSATSAARDASGVDRGFAGLSARRRRSR